MIINILLPGSARYPIGGFKIIFEYANGLSVKGHKVNIILPLNINEMDDSLTVRIKWKYIYYRDKILKKFKANSWFKFDSNINVHWVQSLDQKFIPEGDILVATSWHTAQIANEYSQNKGKKVYFIQSFETWHGSYEDVIATWKMPFKKIVIANWLLEIARKNNEEAKLIYNGFDFNSFGIDVLPQQRDPLSIGMLYHEMEIKGSRFGLEAFEKLKTEYPELEVNLFGVPEKSKHIPEWINYFQNPDQNLLRKIYNNSSIFVNPSKVEGFALTPAEAMICGCAVVVSDIAGHRDYSFNEKTALLFTSENVDSLIEKLRILLNDNDKRINLAKKGNEYINKFQWQDSIDKFEKLILEI